MKQLFNCDDVKGGFDEDRKIGGGICGMNILKKKDERKNWKGQQKPREEHQKPFKKSQLNSSFKAEEKITVQKMN